MTTLEITRSSDVLPEEDVAALQPLIDDIERLKTERNAIVAAHNYMTPDTFHLAADIKGELRSHVDVREAPDPGGPEEGHASPIRAVRLNVSIRVGGSWASRVRDNPTGVCHRHSQRV